MVAKSSTTERHGNLCSKNKANLNMLISDSWCQHKKDSPLKNNQKRNLEATQMCFSVHVRGITRKEHASNDKRNLIFTKKRDGWTIWENNEKSRLERINTHRACWRQEKRGKHEVTSLTMLHEGVAQISISKFGPS